MLKSFCKLLFCSLNVAVIWKMRSHLGSITCIFQLLRYFSRAMSRQSWIILRLSIIPIPYAFTHFSCVLLLSNVQRNSAFRFPRWVRFSGASGGHFWSFLAHFRSYNHSCGLLLAILGHLELILEIIFAYYVAKAYFWSLFIDFYWLLDSILMIFDQKMMIFEFQNYWNLYIIFRYHSYAFFHQISIFFLMIKTGQPWKILIFPKGKCIFLTYLQYSEASILFLIL